MTQAAGTVADRLLSVALGDYSHTRGLKADFQAAWAAVQPINRAFAPMVREHRFDVSELAVATFLQAKAFGHPLVLLPAAVACRFQEGALLCRAADARIGGPRDLVGKRVGVRAYSQTTALWLRGILGDSFGVKPDDVRWTVLEPAHAREFTDPPFVRQLPAGGDLLAMLLADEVDAIIAGNDVPAGPDIRTVFPDPAGAAASFERTHGFEPVNHVLVARRDVAADRPGAVAELLRALARSYEAARRASERVPPLGRQAIQPSIDLALRYAGEQRLLPRDLTAEEAWDGTGRIQAELGACWP